MNRSTSDVVTAVGARPDHGEEDLQVERLRQHRVRSRPRRDEAKVLIQQRLTQPRRTTLDPGQTQHETHRRTPVRRAPSARPPG